MQKTVKVAAKSSVIAASPWSVMPVISIVQETIIVERSLVMTVPVFKFRWGKHYRDMEDVAAVLRVLTGHVGLETDKEGSGLVSQFGAADVDPSKRRVFRLTIEKRLFSRSSNVIIATFNRSLHVLPQFWHDRVCAEIVLAVADGVDVVDGVVDHKNSDGNQKTEQNTD